MLTIDKFEEASEVVKRVTQDTKLIFSDYFSQMTGNKVYFKPENMQRTGAYKLRGAYYKISTLREQKATVRKLSCMEMSTMMPVHMLMSWQKNMDIHLSIPSMIRQ